MQICKTHSLGSVPELKWNGVVSLFYCFTFLFLQLEPSLAQNKTGDCQQTSIPPVTATHGMVASQEAQATKVGIEILKNGGNAIDAAVGVGFALAVTLPSAGNIGGRGFYGSLSRKPQTSDLHRFS